MIDKGIQILLEYAFVEWRNNSFFIFQVIYGTGNVKFNGEMELFKKIIEWWGIYKISKSC